MTRDNVPILFRDKCQTFRRFGCFLSPAREYRRTACRSEPRFHSLPSPPGGSGRQCGILHCEAIDDLRNERTRLVQARLESLKAASSLPCHRGERNDLGLLRGDRSETHLQRLRNTVLPAQVPVGFHRQRAAILMPEPSATPLEHRHRFQCRSSRTDAANHDA
jgi:hypothetical protein